MCLAVPAEVKYINGAFAYVQMMGVSYKVNIELIDELKVGEYVIVHAGCAIEKIDKGYFKYLENVLKEMVENND